MIHIGDVTFQAQRDPIFSAGGFDLDTARVPWQGAATLKAAFAAGLSSFTALPGYSKMWLMRWPEDDDPTFPTLTLEYTGCKNGSAPPPKIDDGRSLQSLSVSVESETYSPGDDVTIQMDIEYYASQTNYSWYSLSTPAANPIYAVARRVIDLQTTVFTRQYRITQSSDATSVPTGKIASVDTGTYTQLNNALVQEHKLQEYKIDELVPSSLWHCQSVVNYMFTAAGV